MGVCFKITLFIFTLLGFAILAIREHNIRGDKLWLNPIPTIDRTLDLSGKKIVVTGSNTGIGKEMVIELLGLGADVVMACRNKKKVEAVLGEIHERSSVLAAKNHHSLGKVSFLELDLSSFKSIERFVQSYFEKYGTVDIFINNAALAGSNLYKTEEGFAQTMGVNHFGVHYLTHLILPKLLKQEQKSRIVIVASDAHKRGEIDLEDIDASTYNASVSQMNAFVAYSTSKLANIIMTREVSARLQGNNKVTINCNHPGFIRTDLVRDAEGWVKHVFTVVSNLIAMDANQGAQNTLYLGIAPELQNTSGEYFSQFYIKEPELPSQEIQETFFKKSCELTGIKYYESWEELL